MKKSLGTLIGETRRAKGMTQLELAQKLGVTDKAVSKWERDLSCPDIGSLPALAQALDLSLEELMEGKARQPQGETKTLVNTILKGVALAMGVAVAVLSLLGALDPQQGLILLGIGLACLGAWALGRED